MDVIDKIAHHNHNFRIALQPSYSLAMPAAAEGLGLGFDHASYPHLMSTVLDHAGPEALLALRGTSRGMRDAADARLFAHVVVGDSDAYTSRAGGYPLPIRSGLARDPGSAVCCGLELVLLLTH